MRRDNITMIMEIIFLHPSLLIIQYVQLIKKKRIVRERIIIPYFSLGASVRIPSDGMAEEARIRKEKGAIKKKDISLNVLILLNTKNEEMTMMAIKVYIATDIFAS